MAAERCLCNSSILGTFVILNNQRHTPPNARQDPVTVCQDDHVVVDLRVGCERKEKREVEAQRDDVTNVAVCLIRRSLSDTQELFV